MSGALRERRVVEGLGSLSIASSALGKKNRACSCRIYFHAKHSEVEHPDSVRVVGNHPSLGSTLDEPEKGLVLQTNEDIFPCWISSEPIFLELNTKVQYKYAVVGKDGSVKSIEEGDPREFIASGPEMTIEDDDGLYRQKAGVAGGSHAAAEAFLNSYGIHEFSLTGIARTVSSGIGGLDVARTRDEKLAWVKDLEGDANFLPEYDTIFMFHFDLPVKVVRKEGGGWETMESAYSGHFLPVLQELKREGKLKVKFIGWPGIHTKSEKEQQQIKRFLEDYDCIPVFPPQDVFEDYLTFTDNYLWPIFHDVLSFFSYANPDPFNEHGWAAYQQINNIYANAIVEHAHQSDLIWIHDYQLMMMPTFIQRKFKNTANIGFFMHVPFPSSDTFKSLPIREELLSGLLCADQVGFQFFASARHFIVGCKRIYGLDPTYRAGGFIGVDYNGRTIAIKVAHFGLPYEKTQELVNSEIVKRKAEEVSKLFVGKQLFVCQDRCLGLSGLTPKFRDFKRFLSENKQYKGKVALVQYLGVGFEESEAEDLLEYLKKEADAILHTDEETGELKVTKTGTGDTCDIYVRFEQHEREDRLALFRAGHVLLDTSVKAGLNLIPFEFITAHHDDTSRPSLVIVSEFSGCSRVLLGSLRINPWSSSETVAACLAGVSMAEPERKDRWESNHSYTSDYSPVQWFEEYCYDLRRARPKESMCIQSIGFGARIRPIATQAGFQRLDSNMVMRSFFGAKRRVLFLDNEGTLAPDRRHLYREYGAPKDDITQLSSHGSGPDATTLEYLRNLTADTRNFVIILSGRPRHQLEAWFSSVPKIGLMAERGFCYKLPSITGDWLSDRQVDCTWKTYAFELMRQFVKRTQGAFVEDKGSALVWWYRDADQHFGLWQAKELSQHLKELLFGFEVEVVEGKGYVEVKLRHINKGVAVTKMLSMIATHFGEADFIICCGDDRSDEDMFEVVNYFSEKANRDNETTSQLSTTDETNDGSDFAEDQEMKTKMMRNPSPDEEASPGSRQGSKEREEGRLTPPSLKRSSHKNLRMMGGDRMPSMESAPAHPGMSTPNLAGSRMGSIAGDLQNLGNVMADDDSSAARKYFTCVIGQKPSAAKFFLNDTDEMSDLLGCLTRESNRRMSHVYNKSDGNLSKNAYTWSGGMEADGGFRSKGSMPSLTALSFTGPSPRNFSSNLNLAGLDEG
jgi:trehalose 6-phosphate synthase/phosphatase